MNSPNRYAVMILCLLTSQVQAKEEPETVRAEKFKDHIDFSIGKDLVARYHFGNGVAKPYLWPVNAPGQTPLTRAWPMEPSAPGGSEDHIHQKSMWFCHGDVIPVGVDLKDHIKGVAGVDFWSENRGHGIIVCTEVAKVESGKKTAFIQTKNLWQTADATPILDEDRTIRLVDLGEARLLVFEIEIKAAYCPIEFGDTKEGAFGVRINDALREGKNKGVIENAEGKKGELNCWGRRSKWCDYSGTVGGKAVGLAIFDDPENPYPACWHSRGYGLMAANPFGRSGSGFPDMHDRKDLVKLAKGETLKLRYGLFLHKDNATAGKVEEGFGKFVKLKSEK